MNRIYREKLMCAGLAAGMAVAVLAGRVLADPQEGAGDAPPPPNSAQRPAPPAGGGPPDAKGGAALPGKGNGERRERQAIP